MLMYARRIFFVMLMIPGMVPALPAQTSQEESPISQGYMVGYQTTPRGWGLSFSYLLGPDQRQWLFGADANLVKDTREIRGESVFGQQGRNYVFGKLNHLIVFSPSVGVQYDLFPIGSGNLLNVRLGAKVGPAIGMTTPYYLEIFQPLPNQPQLGDRIIEAYDPVDHTYRSIIGRASLLDHEFDPSFQVGASAKLFGLFDFSNNSGTIRAVQLGLNADWFPNAVPIMADFLEVPNSRFFVAASVGFFLGNRW